MADHENHSTKLEEAARRSLNEFLERSGRSPCPERREQILQLATLVAQWGSKMNLSGYRDPEAVMTGLICDGLSLWFAVEDHAELSLGANVVDLGSGAGFPGFPLAILQPSISVGLVESRERRHHFQRAVRRDLGLDNVHPLLGRIEDLEPTRSDLVVAQALAQPQAALELGIPWAREGGFLLIPSNRPDPEIRPPEAIQKTGTFSYWTPAKEEPRWIWWGQRAERP